jgi:hypothetical protein
MANVSKWYMTNMPDELVDAMEKSLSNHDKEFDTARTTSGVTFDIRDSKTVWIPDASWIAGLCWHFVKKANDENFLYDIDRFDGGTLQYTSYEPGEYYHWHVDGDVANLKIPQGTPEEQFVSKNTEKCRKLSLIVQLSSPDEYTGGDVQLQYSDGNLAVLPKRKGTVIVFDSRTLHRVKKVTSGRRKSLVAWVEGPRWR